MILLIFILTVLFISKYIIYPYIKYLKYVKHGRGYFLPFAGEIYQQVSSYYKHGDIEYTYKHLQDDCQHKVFVENLFGRIKVKVVNPDILKDFFTQMNSGSYTTDMFFMKNLERLFEKGLVFMQEDKWKNLRYMFSPAFHFEYIKGLSSSVETITDSVFQSYIDSDKLSKVDSIALMCEITSQVIVYSFLGSKTDHILFQGKSLAQSINHIVSKIAAQTFELSYFIFGSKFQELGIFKEHREIEKFHSEFRLFLKEIINQQIKVFTQEYKETGDIKQNCILSQLIKSGNIDKLSDKELFDNFMMLFVAGTDTSSHLVGMAIYYLTQCKESYNQLQQEIDSNKNTPKELIDYPFLNSVLKETQRYYGPQNQIIDRIALRDNFIGDIKIEKGTLVNYQATSIHRNHKYYKDPHSFRPQRWINGETSNLPTYTLVPFSGGKRNCIGQHLALIEARIILSKFVQKFDFSCEKGYVLKMMQGLVLEPRDPLQINVSVRNKQ